MHIISSLYVYGTIYILFPVYMEKYTHYIHSIRHNTHIISSLYGTIHILYPVYMAQYAYYIQSIRHNTHIISSLYGTIHTLHPLYMAQYAYYIQSIRHNTHIISSLYGTIHILNPHFEEQTVNLCCAEQQIICSRHGGSKYLPIQSITSSSVPSSMKILRLLTKTSWLVIFMEIIVAYSAKYSNLPCPI